MSAFRKSLGVVAGIALLSSPLPTMAGTITCAIDALTANPPKNYMQIDDGQASACLVAGEDGTLSGNPVGGNPDEFLTSSAGAGYVTASKTGGTNGFNIQYNQGTGEWSFDASAWNIYATGTKLALGFKWGTGGTPDNYFVFQLVAGVTSGSFLWFPVAPGYNGEGGLSHMILYSTRCIPGNPGCEPPDEVPEPGTLALLGLGLIGLSLMRRRAKA